MSSAQFNAGESHAQAEANTEQWVDSAKNVANSAVNKAENATQRASESAQQNNDKNAGFLQQKGEQMIHMAQGAIDGVKNTLGMGSEKK
ncbi:late embryogenesis abundant protein 1-like [Solanum pennellii]|uniref:Late embryogenesis abundant protein 1-like n=1 Tax=Solanum pennellii TaxID=28526 RepID=A0ABM1GTV7_SOLPN|nr:late embryogenesis abundant protein 1-like [Solanum pennellii]